MQSHTTVVIDKATFNATIYKSVAAHMALDINTYPGGASAYMDELARLRKEFYARARF